MTYRELESLIRYPNSQEKRISEIIFTGHTWKADKSHDKMSAMTINLSYGVISFNISGDEEKSYIIEQGFLTIINSMKNLGNYFYTNEHVEFGFGWIVTSVLLFPFIVYWEKFFSGVSYSESIFSGGNLWRALFYSFMMLLPILFWRIRKITFPSTIFLIGDESRRSSIRRNVSLFIFSTVVMSTLIGLFVNYISNKIF